MSRVAVRDALQDLRQRGLAVDIPLKGTIVRPVSYKTIEELFGVRRVVEAFLARQACAAMSDSDLDQIEAILQQQERLSRDMDMARLVDADWQFHKAIYDHGENEPAREIIVSLWSRIKQARSLAQANMNWGWEWSRRSIARYRLILDALRKRDPNEVERLIVSAIDQSLEELTAGLKEMRWGETNHDGQ